MKPRLAALAVAVVAVAIALAAPASVRAGATGGSGATGAEREFSERISVMAIEIPVRVLVQGRPVAGLEKNHFRVFEGAVEHEIVGFERVDLTGSPAADSPASGAVLAAADSSTALGAGRRLLFLFDIAYSGRRPLARAVDATRGLVASGLHLSDRAAVATYSAVHGLRFLTGFTGEREKTLLALDVVAAGVGGDRQAHREAARALVERGGLVVAGSPLERFRSLTREFGRAAAIAFEEAEADLGILAASGAAGGGAAAASERAGSRFSSAAAAGDPVRGSFQNISPGQIAAGLAEGPGLSGVRALALELAEMATVLRDLAGQKHLFLLSQGFGSRMLEDAAALNHLEKALEALRRANWALQAIDLEGTGFDAHSLFYLANETGGELIENHLDLDQAAAKLMARTAVSYVLTIQPTDVPADDRYRRLEVKLRDGPRRARVIHRPGYYTPKPRSARNSLENTLDAAALLLSDREMNDFSAEVLAMPLPGRGLAEVPVVVELPIAKLMPPPRGGVVLEFHGYALDPAGEIQDLFSQRVRLGRDDLRDLAQAGGGLRFFDRVALPVGQYALRLLVRNAASGKAFLATVPVTVSSALGEPGVHGPLFAAEDSWALLRGEGSLNGGRGVEHPFVLAGRPRIPSPRPAVAAGASTTFFLKMRLLDAADLRIGARILGADGRPVDGGALAFSERVLGEDDRVDALVGTLAAGGLEPGSYRLEVTATWAGGTRRSVGIGDFRVVAR